MSDYLKSQFLTNGRRPRCAANPNFPTGIVVDFRSHPHEPSCATTLSYPLQYGGVHMVECRLCGMAVAITAAGRPDDPHTAILACKRKERAP